MGKANVSPSIYFSPNIYNAVVNAAESLSYMCITVASESGPVELSAASTPRGDVMEMIISKLPLIL